MTYIPEARFPPARLEALPIHGCKAGDPDAIGTADMGDLRFTSRCGSITRHHRHGTYTSLVWQQIYLPKGGLYKPDHASKRHERLLMRVYAVFELGPLVKNRPAITKTADAPTSRPGEELLVLPIRPTALGQEIIYLRCTSSESMGITKCRGVVGISSRVGAMIQIHPLHGHVLNRQQFQKAVDDALAITSVIQQGE